METKACLDCGVAVYRKAKRCRKCFNATKRKPNGKHYVHTVGNAFEHVLVWTAANGPVPKGWLVHHKDENRRNNALENLECMSRQHHMRIHAGWELKAGVWFKPCPGCGCKKPLTEFYLHRINGSYQSRCKPCVPKRWGPKKFLLGETAAAKQSEALTAPL